MKRLCTTPLRHPIHPCWTWTEMIRKEWFGDEFCDLDTRTTRIECWGGRGEDKTISKVVSSFWTVFSSPPPLLFEAMLTCFGPPNIPKRLHDTAAPWMPQCIES